jgi:hypothetical protein
MEEESLMKTLIQFPVDIVKEYTLGNYAYMVELFHSYFGFEAYISMLVVTGIWMILFSIILDWVEYQRITFEEIFTVTFWALEAFKFGVVLILAESKDNGDVILLAGNYAEHPIAIYMLGMMGLSSIISFWIFFSVLFARLTTK